MLNIRIPPRALFPSVTAKVFLLGSSYLIGNLFVRAFSVLSPRMVQDFEGTIPTTTTINGSLPFETLTLELGKPIPRGVKPYHFTLPSIYSDNFFDELENLLTKLHNDSKEQFSIILQPSFTNGQRRTLGHSFTTNIQPKMNVLKDWLQPLIDNFAAQSASGEEMLTDATIAIIRNVTDLPEPQATPITSSPANVMAIKESKAEVKKAIDRERKRLTSTSVQSKTLEAVNLMSANFNTSIETQTTLLKELISSNKASTVPQSIPSTDWTPLISAIAALCSLTPIIVVKYLGLDPEILKASVSTPSKTTSLDLDSIKSELSSQLDTKVKGMQKEINDLKSQYNTLQSNMNSMHKTLSNLDSKLDRLVALVTPSSNNSSSNGSSTPPAAPSGSSEASTPNSSSKKSPSTEREIKALLEAVPLPNYNGQIVTADLEAIITPEGYNKVFMAAWYNGTKFNIYDITQFSYNSSTMLEMFWQDLIQNNKGKECYFHNWGGYDSILSLAALLNISGYKFKPLLNQGEMMAIKVTNLDGEEVLSIKDSIRILPSSLAKLAKDWKVETQKEHFPHYFFLDNIESTLNYNGPLPAYEYFEPKRTSQANYTEMIQEFKNKQWSFLDISKFYILGDVKSLYQIMIKFFETLTSKFPIDPLKVLSAPSTAFKIWRTVQLPKLNKELLKVYDLSSTLDSKFRMGYCGGIVDVYQPVLKGNGYYYDVNSLYPTAMCKPMPVGMPKLVSISPKEFEEGFFFGYVQATVQAPPIDTYPGYLGLLPLKYQGRLICPGGMFSGFFFSEELYFALNNGYKLLSITQAYEFQRGANTFYELIQHLNSMKVEAQLNEQPTIRNLAKLLMNSMYGRFGMHTDNLRHEILNQEQIAKLSKDFIIKEEIPFGKLSLVTYTLTESNFNVGTQPNTTLRQNLQGMPGNTNVAIAAAVTAYSRMIINQYKLLALEQGLDIFYSDTDSLVLNGQLPAEVCDPAKLGLLKLEYEFKEGLFVMPKVYYLELADGKGTIISKCKGYSGKLNKDQYLSLLEGKTLTLNVTKWVRSLKQTTIQILKGTRYTISPTFNKRNKVLDKNGKWVNTSPIKLG